MPAESEFPEADVRRAWARAFRHTEADSGEGPPGHDDPRLVALPGDVIALVAVDERDGRRFARVTVRRAHGETLQHEEAVPLVARVYLLGRFEPFPVECVIGADRQTLHYVIDLEAYKDARAQDHIASAASMTGADAATGDAEIAAIQLACPLWALARTWNREKAEARDPRTITFLSDRFLVPRSWIEFQIDHFFAELADGAIDEHGMPRTKDDAT